MVMGQGSCTLSGVGNVDRRAEDGSLGVALVPELTLV